MHDNDEKLEVLMLREGQVATLSKLDRIERILRENHRIEMARLDTETDEIDAVLKAMTTEDPALKAATEKARGLVRKLKVAFQNPPTTP